MALNTLLQIVWLPFLLLLTLLLLLKKNKKPLKHYPPSPPKLPIIGNLHQFTRSGSPPHQNLWRLSKKFGPVMLLHLGRIPTIIISSAGAAKQVLKDNDLNCCTRPTSTGSRKLTFNYLDMAFAPYGEYWREIRKICVLELFSVKRVQSYRGIREEEVAKMIGSISRESASSTSSCVDLTEKLYAVMASMAFRIIFGTSFEGSTLEHSRFQQVLHETGIMLSGFCAADYFNSKIGYIIDKISGKQKQFERVSGELHGFFQQVIDDHLKPGRTQQVHDDIVDVLLKI
ncbi:cytochrome P450 71B36-like [Argentina anserina]|uniref:cytochrome P450 71B36-like n=1 Tax=Argentina anserina TaxID=57926 RepID=UPI0021768DF8|nr:cytochrome P450 71B36-like [Potentilla anserina]